MFFEVQKTECNSPTFQEGKFSFDGIMRQVNLCMILETSTNDYILVHVGLALQLIDLEEVKKILKYVKEMDELKERDREV